MNRKYERSMQKFTYIYYIILPFYHIVTIYNTNLHQKENIDDSVYILSSAIACSC